MYDIEQEKEMKTWSVIIIRRAQLYQQQLIVWYQRKKNQFELEQEMDTLQDKVIALQQELLYNIKNNNNIKIKNSRKKIKNKNIFDSNDIPTISTIW